MFFVRDKGRLCNNILQFGHVYAWCREHGRNAISMRFAYKYQYFEICLRPGHNFLTYLFAKAAAAMHLLPVVSFDAPDSDRSLEDRMKSLSHCVVQGWEVRFYDLFLKYRTEITSLFQFLPAIERIAEQRLSESRGALRVGIHLRRGDYSRWHGGKYLYDDSQMARACQRIAEQYPDRDIHFYLCGNDPDPDKRPYEQLADASGRLHFSFPNGNPGEDLCLFSKCDILAGAPSTFTLVAAMYRDIPLWWIKEADESPRFGKFADLFRNIL
ncbi:MAG: glycosyltransferase [Muribaculum sp.]|nr:glycosyltransferase [Muribaculum sp.]